MSSQITQPIAPKVGMVFGSPDEAHQFYKLYARQTGFGITRRTSHNFYGIKYDVTFSCNKNRKPAQQPVEGFKSRTRAVLGTGCRARIVLRDRLLKGNWTVEEAILEHNHELSPDCVRLMRCHRELPQFVKKQLEINELAGLAQQKSIQAVFTQSGDVTHCTFTERDMRNYISEVRRLQLKDGDAAALMKYFKHQQRRCPNFYYVPDIDDDGRLRNVFWADARSRAAFKYFGDVITFDTTYLTNKYRMPFVVFVGVNHHGQSILLGCALLSNELKETFNWCFLTFLDCMNGKAPQAIITDQCSSIGAAVNEILPTTRHRLCLWHILKKVPEKLAGVEDKEEVMHYICRTVYDSDSREEFDFQWENMLTNVKWGSHKDWFQEMYEIRHKWVPVYVKDAFWAGMSTTQRSEGINAFFDSYVNTKTSLKAFVEKYGAALHYKWEKERQEDFRCRNLQPYLVTSFAFEKQFANTYTLNVFYQYQREIKHLMSTFYQDVSNHGAETTVCVRELTNPKTFHVVIDNESRHFKCSCKLFEFRGIVCRHALCVYRQLDIETVPDSYVMNRWRKDYVRTHIAQTVPDLPVLRGVATYNDTYVSANNLLFECVEIASQSVSLPEALIQGMQQLKVCLCESLKKEAPLHKDFDHHSTDSSSAEDTTRDPVAVRSKGRPRATRIKGVLEKRKKKKRTNQGAQQSSADSKAATEEHKGRPRATRIKGVLENRKKKKRTNQGAQQSSADSQAAIEEHIKESCSIEAPDEQQYSALQLLLHFHSYKE